MVLALMLYASASLLAGPAGKGGHVAFTLTSPAFAQDAPIPARFSCDGADVSPQLEWSGAPAGTKSFALIVDDPDAPSGTFTHWVLYDIPANRHSLEEGQKPGGVGLAGKNDFAKSGYGGPCPPRGHGPHRYFFTLSALDIQSLGLPAGATRQQVESKMRGHVVGAAKVMGKYERK